MKTKFLTPILVICALFTFSFTENIFAQEGGQAYINVQVWQNGHSRVQQGAEVWVTDSQGNTVLSSNERTNSQGWIGFSANISSGTYTAHACYPPRPDNEQGGTTVFYYSGTGSVNEEVELGNPYK